MILWTNTYIVMWYFNFCEHLSFRNTCDLNICKLLASQIYLILQYQTPEEYGIPNQFVKVLLFCTVTKYCSGVSFYCKINTSHCKREVLVQIQFDSNKSYCPWILKIGSVETSPDTFRVIHDRDTPASNWSKNKCDSFW